MAAYEVISPVFEDIEPIFTAPAFLPGEVFPLRVKVKPLPDISEPVPFKPLMPALLFIKNKVLWSGSIRGAMRTIPKDDYQRIIAGGA
jgi:predicted RNA-binding protein